MRDDLVIGSMVLAVSAAACGDNSAHDDAIFTWDTSRVLGSLRIDGRDPDSHVADHLMDDRAANGGVALFYGHLSNPGTAATVEGILIRAQHDHLPALTFQDLVYGQERDGIAISFDDADYGPWTELQPMLARYGARVTLFVTEYPTATADERAELHALADAGNDIEAHGIHHVNALDYAREHGVDALVHDEVIPSFDVLRADGFDPCCYAHPYGATDETIDGAILDAGVSLVRRITPRI